MTRPAVLERPIVRAQIKAYIVQGKGDAEIGALVNLSRQAVYTWRKRLEAETAPLIASREDAIVAVASENWIADKQQRLARLEQMFTGLAQFVATDEEGYAVGKGSIVSQMRGILSDAATELGQLPKADQNINLRAQVLIREYTGVNPESIG